jgi:HSP20 family protein
MRHINDLNDLYQRSRTHFNFIGTEFVKTDTGYTLELMVPGFTKEELQININDDNELVVEGETNDLHSKKIYRSFSQRWPLPKNADTDSVIARLENGVLTIYMGTKTTYPSGRRIYIS